jgi:antitoxin component of RelBE/YafQ-DinJ toxin-antitoxin module
MPRKVVKVYVSKKMKEMLDTLSSKLGLPESEVMRIALFELASKHNLVNPSS